MSETETDTAVTPPADGNSPPIDGCRVLIVDDNATNRRILKMTVGKMGITDIDIAEDGVEALERVAAKAPDLVLLDVVMPRMDGFEVCRKLRADPAHSDIPILIQTALTDGEERANCFAAGASDVVSRPFNYVELMARIRIHLERRMMVADLQRYRARVASELEAARSAQTVMIPTDSEVAAAAETYGVAMAARFEPSSEVGGDYWTLFQLDEARLGLFTADFTGHGVRAAFNTFRLTTLLRQMEPADSDPGVWLTGLNKSLNSLLLPGEFATVFYGIIDMRDQSLTYASAGAPPPILMRAGAYELIDTRGFFLGLLPQARYESKRLALGDQAGLFLYSDAITECHTDASGGTQMLGEEGLAALLLEANTGTLTERLDQVLDKVHALPGAPLPDDLTAVWVELG